MEVVSVIKRFVPARCRRCWLSLCNIVTAALKPLPSPLTYLPPSRAHSLTERDKRASCLHRERGEIGQCLLTDKYYIYLHLFLEWAMYEKDSHLI